MGEARRRGTYEQRKAAALKLAKANHERLKKVRDEHPPKPLSAQATALLALGGFGTTHTTFYKKRDT